MDPYYFSAGGPGSVSTQLPSNFPTFDGRTGEKFCLFPIQILILKGRIIWTNGTLMVMLHLMKKNCQIFEKFFEKNNTALHGSARVEFKSAFSKSGFETLIELL